MNDLECPYCGEGLEVCHDDGQGYEEDERHEMGCFKCGKEFVFTTSITFYYEPSMADCLNGAHHVLKPSKTIPEWYTKMECVDCDFKREPNIQEKETYKIPNRHD